MGAFLPEPCLLPVPVLGPLSLVLGLTWHITAVS